VYLDTGRESVIMLTINELVKLKYPKTFDYLLNYLKSIKLYLIGKDG
jgi:hypothetical protein